MTEVTTDPIIGRLLDGRYEVRSRIARGGMATVYLATDRRLERRVAVKVMHGHLADDSQFTERFIQEARSAARLAHPNVVNVFDQGQDNEMAYLVMEYLPGRTLRDLLREHKVLTPEQTLEVMEAVLSGLAAAHKAGIVHRDLKPENVLLADDGRIKIGDFGLARAVSANTATGAALLGTIAYLSPELVTRGIADTRSDIYAVGIMMYEMLTGEQPFKGSQPMQIAFQHANDTVPPPSGKNPRVPAEIDELVLWATAKDAAQRPRDARVMLDQLKDTARDLETAIRPARSTSATAATTVMLDSPATMVLAGGTAETQRIGGIGGHADTGAIETEATTSLARVSAKRRSRGRWLFALVLLIAGVGGGAGWYFGAGPGGHSTIPASLVGTSEDAATADILAAGLAVGESSSAYSPTVAEGLVVSTDPPAGSTVPKGSEVTLVLSKGPQPVRMPKLKGLTVEEAAAVLAQNGLVYDATKNTEQFTTSTAPNVVIMAYGTDPDSGESLKLAEGADYIDRGVVWFHVALGPLPDVVGSTIDSAIAALQNVGVTGTVAGEDFSDTVEKGRVISATPADDRIVRPGDTIDLVVSKGPDLVALPENIVGDTINSAQSRLEAAGFEVTVDTNVPNMFGSWDRFVVTSVSGESLTEDGTQAKRGSAITIHANYDSGGD